MRWALGEPVEVGETRVIPLLVDRRDVIVSGRGGWLAGERSPVAVVIARPGAVRAFLVDGREADLARLLETFPGLEQRLELPAS